MDSKIFCQGRIVAPDYHTAVCKITEQLAEKGYAPAREPRVFESPIQPYNEGIWWEYLCEVIRGVMPDARQIEST